MIPSRLSAISIIAILAASTAAHATEGEEKGGTYHDRPTQDIVVTALLPRTQSDILSGTSVISATELTRQLRTTIGETLARQPGVSSSSFGPNASRPILRGFQGERVRILTDGIGSFDVSNTSADHAVAINPLTAERIEVLRGPAALLYGSSAVGGVVNVIDGRIPHRVPDEPIHVEGLATYGSAANERTLSGKAEVPLTPSLVAHVDGSWSKSDDLHTGGFILSRDLRAQAIASGDPAIADLANLRGDLPNSGAKSWEVAGALAYINDVGDLGLSVSHSDNLYGVPIRFSLTPGGEAEQVRLHMKQTRADWRGDIHVNGPLIDQIHLRAGWAQYQHQEIAQDGTVGTTFYSKAIESRLEMVQTRQGGWDGAIGAQMFVRDFNVIGDEKFLPANATEQFGLFTLQSLDFGSTRLEAGARIEHSIISATADAALGTNAVRRSFNALSLSAGASQEIIPGWRIGLNLARTQRAPAAEELFARGPHAGTQAFEVGNPGFGLEKSKSMEASLRGSGRDYKLSLAAYHSWFDGYIYDGIVDSAVCQAVLGATPLDLPCFQYNQAKARYYGVEGEISVTIARFGETSLAFDAMGDYVHATIIGSGPAPRIPPLRLMTGAELTNERLTARIEGEHSFAQRRVAAFETDTNGYTLVNASLTWQPIPDNKATTLTLSANNIFDVTARRAASVLKDYAPLSGRDIRLTVRLGF